MSLNTDGTPQLPVPCLTCGSTTEPRMIVLDALEGHDYAFCCDEAACAARARIVRLYAAVCSTAAKLDYIAYVAMFSDYGVRRRFTTRRVLRLALRAQCARWALVARVAGVLGPDVVRTQPYRFEAS